MKTKRIEKKLNLNKTTITTIAENQLNNVNGGGTLVSCVSVCYPTCIKYENCDVTDYAKCTGMTDCAPYC